MMFARVLTHRYTLIAISVIFLIVSLYIMGKAFGLVVDNIDNVEGIDTLLNSLGTIFIAYGVALEGRRLLMTFFGLYPKYRNEKEETVDQICEHYGLLLVIGGLCMEVAGELVMIPSHFMNLKNIEEGVFGFGVLFWLICVWLMVRKVKLLLVCEPTFPGQAGKMGEGDCGADLRPEPTGNGRS